MPVKDGMVEIHFMIGLHLYRFQGNSEDTSVPVVLWGKRVIHSGPFEPNTDDWTNINTILLTTLTKEE